MNSQRYWDQKYKEGAYQSGKTPLPFLVEMLPRLKKGKVLDIGMGEGTNSVYLAQKGMQVKGVDISNTAVDRAKGLAQETGVSIEAQTTDLDLFLFGLMEYDSIIMTFFKPGIARYYSEIMRALKQGGTLLIHSYTTEEMTEPMAQDDFRNIYYRSNEPIQQLKGMRFLYYNEGLVDGKHVIQCLAQKPFDKDAGKYNLFDMQTTDVSKGKSTQQSLAESLFKKK